MASLPVPSSVLVRPFRSHSLFYSRHPVHGPALLPPDATQPASFTSSASFLCILPCSAYPPRPQPPSCSAGALHPFPKPRFRPGRGLAQAGARAPAPAMLITLCYLYLWARWGRRPAALVLSTVRRLRASRCSFTFCRAAAQPGGARVCLSRGGRVFCVGESQVGGGRGRRVDRARRQHCCPARTAHACTGAWEALLRAVGRGPAAPPSCLRSCSCSRDIPRGT